MNIQNINTLVTVLDESLFNKKKFSEEKKTFFLEIRQILITERENIKHKKDCGSIGVNVLQAIKLLMEILRSNGG